MTGRFGGGREFWRERESLEAAARSGGGGAQGMEAAVNKVRRWW